MNISEYTRSPPLVLAEELTSHFKCPICGRLYFEPVISIKCGHTFCKKCAFSATHCPVDGNHCDTTQLVVNRFVHLCSDHSHDKDMSLLTALRTQPQAQDRWKNNNKIPK